MSSCVPRAGEPGGVCSGRGYCLESNETTLVPYPMCVCEPGWYPIGDFATDPSVDCGINFLAVRILWGVCALASGSVLILAINRIFRSGKDMLKLHRIDTKIFISAFLLGSTFTIIGIMQAASDAPGARSIGIDPVTTTLFVVGSSAFFLGWGAYSHSLLMLAYHQARLTVQDKRPIREHHVRYLRLLMPLQMFIAVLGCFIVFGFLGGNPRNDQIYGSIHYMCCVVAVGILILHCELIINPLAVQVRTMREEGNVHSNVEQAMAFLEKTRREFRYNAIIQSIINFSFGAVPVLLRKVPYQLPLAWLFISLGTIDIIQHVGKAARAGGSKSKSSSRESKVKSTDRGVDATTSVDKPHTMVASTVRDY